MSLNKKKKILLLLIIFVCCFVAAGYFVLVQAMLVEGKVRLYSPKLDVEFKDIKTIKTIGEAKNYKFPLLEKHHITFFAELESVGDSITYKIKIKNVGNVDARLTDINLIPEIDNKIKYVFNGLMIGEVLKPNESKNVTLKVEYENQSDDKKEDFREFKLWLDWKQND